MLERAGDSPRGVRDPAFSTAVGAAAPSNVGIFNGAPNCLGADCGVDRGRDGVLVLSHTSNRVLHKSSGVAHVSENGSGPEELSARAGNELCIFGGIGTTLMSK